MIDVALSGVAADLNAFLQRQQRDKFDRVVLSNLVDQDGKIPIETEEKIVLLVTSLEEERNVLDLGGVQRGAAYAQSIGDPMHLNIHVMFAATCKRYETGLRLLSSVIGYLREKPSFTRENTPSLGAGIDRLNFNMEKLGYAEMSNLWSFIGAKYVPSVCYTIRMVTLGQRQIQRVVPSITEPSVAV